ncbi:MAG: hypothetical protein AAF609_14875 [Cyanobacteria bacterium P01_C01_bin.120]
MKAYSRYNLIIICAALLGVLSIGLFNLLIDPFGILGSPAIAGLNQEKPKEASHVRLFKAVDVVRIKPRAVFIGTSGVEYGLNPNHPSLANYQPVYNLGLPDSNAYEQLRYLEHAIANQPGLEVVVVGLDFVSYNHQNVTEVDFHEDRLGQDHVIVNDLLKVMLSIDALEASIETITENTDESTEFPYYSNGTRNGEYFNSNKPMIDIFQEYLKTYLHRSELYGQFSLSPEMLDSLKAIVDLCEEHDIELNVFVSPFHASHLEAIQAANLWSVFEDWKRQVVEITPIWDFSVYNFVTAETISDDMQYFRDSAHYREEVGNLILNCILQSQDEEICSLQPQGQNIPEAFGVLVTPDNIATHLEQIRRDRESWATKNSEIVEMVQILKAD